MSTNLEKEQLDAWYAKLDAIESKLLGDNADSQINLTTLQTQPCCILKPVNILTSVSKNYR